MTFAPAVFEAMLDAIDRDDFPHSEPDAEQRERVRLAKHDMEAGGYEGLTCHAGAYELKPLELDHPWFELVNGLWWGMDVPTFRQAVREGFVRVG